MRADPTYKQVDGRFAKDPFTDHSIIIAREVEHYPVTPPSKQIGRLECMPHIHGYDPIGMFDLFQPIPEGNPAARVSCYKIFDGLLFNQMNLHGVRG
jgi:hypothetical protein